MRIVVLVGLSALFFWLFLTRYWFHRTCIDAALSSCVLEDGTNLTAGGMIWGVVAALLLLAALVLAIRKRLRR